MPKQYSLYLFKALGEPTKHGILRALLKGERCACELPSLIGKTQSNTSMQLAKLQSWGIVASRKEGRKIIYRISDGRVRAVLKASEGKA
jgi:ArsR family transcriptional regulator